MVFNEDSRVKIPAIIHLCRLGFTYISKKKNSQWNIQTNIFTDIFENSILRINPEINSEDVKRLLEDIYLALDSDDLGAAFSAMLNASSGIKLIDFENFDNNTFNIVTELTCKNGDDEFRPDITLLINGMPLAFVEVKKPSNKEGTLAERDRMDARFKNKKFRRFINISQILVFSNNMEYDADVIEPIQGAFYATTSYTKAHFNYFREEALFDLANILKPNDEEIENFVLTDNGLSSQKHAIEFKTNKEPNTPTNRLLTSLFCRERFKFLLQYSLAYVKSDKGNEKHIMRYPQLFATKAIERSIENGIRSGIIWHTQGSGKTALAFYNVKFLTDFFQKRGIIPKFYFIVDRIDLAVQAKTEFIGRGLTVKTVSSKEDLVKNFELKQAVHNASGKREITVVNIHKFNLTEGLEVSDYGIKTQRIYFIDEVHRSYSEDGNFLANLRSSDRNAVMIGLTGTPLIGKSFSKNIFGDYIHKYYYNASIADGYTLKLIREDIETQYKIQLQDALKEIEILKGDIKSELIYAHPKFVEPMLDYIVSDFEKSRIYYGDKTIGAMVVCDSSEQARKLFDIFEKKYGEKPKTDTSDERYSMAADNDVQYKRSSENKKLSAALILHDESSRSELNRKVQDFKEGKIDILFVYQMLLTGFDAPRLKKLYLGRIVKDHNLLQTLTRVNRPYKNFRYGYVVDFADISAMFEKVNKAYFEELQAVLGDEMQAYSNLLKPKEEIEAEIADIKDKLFHYDLKNAEIFSQQITEIRDRETILDIKRALENAKSLSNIIRSQNQLELLNRIDFSQLSELYKVAAAHLDLLNFKLALENKTDTTNLLNVALENVYFLFKKVNEHEMVIADKLKDTLRNTREILSSNFDQSDPEYVTLYEEFVRLFTKKRLDEISQTEMNANIKLLKGISDKVLELNRKNNLLRAKYENDAKYARMHKRILEKGNISQRESAICEALTDIKNEADAVVMKNQRVLEHENLFISKMNPWIISSFEKNSIKLDTETTKFINSCLVKEYFNEYKQTNAWI